MKEIVNNILSVSPDTFKARALAQFRFQYQQNLVYKKWVDALQVEVENVTELSQIPFLPVSFFKTDKVITGNFAPQIIFESSGTTGTVNSRHFVKDLNIYTESFTEGFRTFYGDPKDWCIIGLLPSYLERDGSSLIMMVKELIELSGLTESGFYLNEFYKLSKVLQDLETRQQKTLLIGVTFALLDLAEQFPMELKHTTIMETGGMKGRRREMVREEVHGLLQQQLKVPAVHSEYGMTELLSQGYSLGGGIFNTVSWMKVLVRDEDDPLLITDKGRGLINVIDLANIYSCSFIATDDVGRLSEDGSFEVLGRRDNSDIRGCSLMVM
ncbi:LuxE/PaaK family acyltransferase [Segetibacter aerophilus]|uniref:Acyltransferase n=1 Tax=Segetibacter aerophilus TaxID=670293 RepID=A0A512B9A3_9BACT|nr:acyl transferase [Segetibacter aerophilus]GEO08513.1 acyltransferase [Segetibacter aerophilus]